MTALKKRYRRRSEGMWERASDALAHPLETFEERPYLSTGGLVALVVGVGLFIWLFPELRRYIRMERM
jgi:hypothetical protein